MDSSVSFVLRTKETEENEKFHAISNVTEIPVDTPCLIVLPGNGAKTDAASNAEAKFLRQDIINPIFVEKMGVDVPVYAAVYHFDKDNDKDGMKQVMARNTELTPQRLYDTDTAHNITFFDDKTTEKQLESVMRFRMISKRRFVTKPVVIDVVAHDKFLKTARRILAKFKSEGIEVADDALEQINISHLDDGQVNSLFDTVIRPRITDKNGMRLDLETAMLRMRNVTFFAHCYGAYLAKRVQAKTAQEMKQIGYDNDEIQMFLNQMLIVAHAPSCELTKQTEHFISFASVADNFIDLPRNAIVDYLREKMRQDDVFSLKNDLAHVEHEWMEKYLDSLAGVRVVFLDKRYGNLFLIPRGYDYYTEKLSGGHGWALEEHSFLRHRNGGVDFVADNQPQNDEGDTLNYLEGLVLINGIRHSQTLAEINAYIPLPNVSKLAFEPRANPKIFENMKANGNKIVAEALKYAAQKLLKKTSTGIQHTEIKR